MSPKPPSNTTVPALSAQEFLAGRIDYERTQSMPCSEESLKLGRMRDLLQRLENPQDHFPIVHIAGTKGKGSTAAMIAALLSAAGYRSGLFTSPHLERVEERIVLNGQPCPPADFADLIESIRPHIEAMDRAAANLNPPENGPTYFEILTALALYHFARQHADAAVLEVGLGGRLDSTNVCQPCLSIITSISLDHTKQLGETLAAIAAEKAGIIKPGIPVISGVTQDEPREVIRRIARENGCRLLELGRDFHFDYQPPRNLETSASLGRLDFYFAASDDKTPATAESHLERPADQEPAPHQNLPLRLPGRHQAANAALAVATVEQLRSTGWKIPEEAIRYALARVTWPARVEVVARRPCVVLDAAHNAASIAALVESLEKSFAARRRFLIFATTLEKDLPGMLQQLLGRFDDVLFTQYQNNPRGVPPKHLQVLAKELSGIDYPTFATPGDAWDAVRRAVTPDDLVCITGSFFLAAEMRPLVESQPLTQI